MGVKIFRNGAWEDQVIQIIDKSYMGCASSMMKIEPDIIEFVGSSATSRLQVLNQMIFGRFSFQTIKALSFSSYLSRHKIGVLDPIGNQEESIGKLLGLNCTHVTNFLIPILVSESGLPVSLTIDSNSHACYLVSKEEIPAYTLFEIKFIGTLESYAYCNLNC